MSGSSGIGTHSVARDNSASLSAADDQNISSLLGGTAWNGTTITYSFPTSSGQYGTQTSYGHIDPFNGFSQLDSVGHSGQKAEVQRALTLIASYTNLTFTQITETTSTHATVRLANTSPSTISTGTSEAYLPSTAAAGGDVFFGGTGKNPVMGNFDSGQTTLHEIGHALGLKHGQDRGAYGTMNPDRLDIEFSLMNYANYIGSAEGYATSSTSAQTYMMYDIAALQYMYGANFNQVGHNNSYTWSSSTGTEFVNGASLGTPYNGHIFETIWTAGATSTYDLSNFSQNQVDDMNPGGWMLFSTSQLADLNFYAPSKPSGEIFAHGNIYNALEYNGDARSLITNIVTGSGADTITGNAADNTIKGSGGNDTIDGGAGTDTAVFSGSRAAYTLTAFGTSGILAVGPDGNDTLTNIERLAFDDQTITWPPTGSPVVPPPVVPPPVVPTGPQVHLAATSSIGAHPAGWLPTATGDFNHDGTSDLLWFNAANRDLDLWKIANGQWAGSSDLGAHPLGWQPAGSGDFNSDGTSDVLWYNATNGGAEIWKIANGQWTGSANLGAHPLGWQPAGSGDFNGDGTGDMLWYNATNGDAEVWKITNGQWAGSIDIGAHPLGWQPVATGDFDHDGTSDVLWYNPATRDLELWKVSNGHWAGSVDIGTHPAGWAPIGAGDFNGDGTSDVAWFNATSSHVEVWLIANGHWAASVDLGAHAAGWSPAGIGDFNGDHVSDIAWREASTGQIETWLLAFS